MEWVGKITVCRNSGQPVKTWCKENVVCEQTYYKWLKLLVRKEGAYEILDYRQNGISSEPLHSLKTKQVKFQTFCV